VTTRYQTKPGKHGTLTRYRVRYHDEDEPGQRGVDHVWAYDEEHARELFDEDSWDQNFDTLRIDSIERVRVA